MMLAIQQAVECVLSLFLIGLVGFILDKKGWFCAETKAMLPRLVTMVTLPIYLFGNIINTFSHDMLLQLAYGIAIPAASILLTFGVALIIARLIRVRRGRRGLFCTSFATSNTIFIGLPVNVALFGEDAIPYVLLYFFANTTFFWTIGNYCLGLDGDRAPMKIWSLKTAKQVFSPPLVGFLLGVLLVLLSIRPPSFVMSAVGYLGSLTTPLAIIFIGLTLASIKLKTLSLELDVVMLLVGRFIVSPLTIILLIHIFSLPPLMAKVFIIQSSLPVVSSAALLAGYYHSDTAYASVVVSLSTLMSLAIIPFYTAVIALRIV